MILFRTYVYSVVLRPWKLRGRRRRATNVCYYYVIADFQMNRTANVTLHSTRVSVSFKNAVMHIKRAGATRPHMHNIYIQEIRIIMIVIWKFITTN